MKISISEKSKANTSTTVRFFPDKTDFPDVVVEAEEILNGEMFQYYNLANAVGKKRKNMDLDYRQIVADKVMAIEGLYVEIKNGDKIEEKEIKTAEDLLSLPMNFDISRLILVIANKIMLGATLTEDEEKN